MEWFGSSTIPKRDSTDWASGRRPSLPRHPTGPCLSFDPAHNNMLPRACRYHFTRKGRVGFTTAARAPATHRTLRLVGESIPRRSPNHRHRELGTAASGSEGTEGQGGAEGGRSTEPAAPAQYELPAPTWSLSDLNVTTDDEEARETARAALSPDEVKDGVLPCPRCRLRQSEIEARVVLARVESQRMLDR